MTVVASTWSWGRWFWPALVGSLLADLVSKWAVHAALIRHWDHPSWITWAYNPGVAFSLFAGHPEYVTVLTLVLIPVLAAVWWRGPRREGRWQNLAFGLILGGALGNAVDRVWAQVGQLAGVRDFISVDLGFWPFNPWPTFNLADSAICIGFVLLIVLSFRSQPRPSAAIAP